MERARLMKARWIMTGYDYHEVQHGSTGDFGPDLHAECASLYPQCSVDLPRLLMHSDHYPQITESLY